VFAWQAPTWQRSGIPDVRQKLATIGFRQSSERGPLSNALMRVESSLVSSVFTAEHSDALETTYFVLTQGTARWTAFLFQGTNQFFIQAPALKMLNKESLLMLLDLAEELGVVDAFVCVSRTGPDCEKLVAEFLNLDFVMVSPISELSNEFILLRFQF